MRFAPLLFIVVLAGCDLLGLGGDLVLMTDQPAYAAEEQVHLVLHNESSTAVSSGALDCAGLEQKVGEHWAPGPESLRYCTAVLLGLAPGESVEAAVPLDQGIAPGTYRFTFAVGEPGEYPDRFRIIYSNPFEVR